MKRYMKQMVSGLIVVAMLLGTGSAASALVTGGASDAYNVYVDVSVPIAGLGVQVGPAALSQGTAPAPYDETNSVAVINGTASVGVSGLATLSTNVGASANVLTTNATSNVDGSSGLRSAQGSQEILGLNAGAELELSVLPVLPWLGLTITTSDILNISSSTITSEANVAGDNGALTTTGSSVIENLKISLYGSGLIDINALLNGLVTFDPNTSVNLEALGLADASLILNEQNSFNDGSNAWMEVNAIHLTINDHSLLGYVVNTEVIIGHAYAALTSKEDTPPVSVPEPSTLMLFGSGLIGLAAFRRRLK